MGMFQPAMLVLPGRVTIFRSRHMTTSHMIESEILHSSQNISKDPSLNFWLRGYMDSKSKGVETCLPPTIECVHEAIAGTKAHCKSLEPCHLSKAVVLLVVVALAVAVVVVLRI